MSTPDNVIFVFGSNTQGRHGKGAALHAVKEWGAIYGQARGRQGDAYAIVTKELRRDYPAITLDDIREEVANFRGYASIYPSYRFKVTAIGCGLAGFTPEQIAPLFMNPWDRSVPPNVILPKEFKDVIKACKAESAVHTRSPTFQITASEYLNDPPIMFDDRLDALTPEQLMALTDQADFMATGWRNMQIHQYETPLAQEPDGTRRPVNAFEREWYRRELARLLEHPNQEIEERDDEAPF